MEATTFKNPGSKKTRSGTYDIEKLLRILQKKHMKRQRKMILRHQITQRSRHQLNPP